MQNTDANNAAAPSSVATETPVQEVEQSIPSAGPERIEWQKTGKITPKAVPAPASEVDSKEKTESAAASEAAPQEKSRDNAATRLLEILADLKKAGLSPAELKSFKREAQKAETQAEPSPAKAPAPVIQLTEPKEPDMGAPEYQGGDGWDKYQADVRKFTRDLAKYEAAKAVDDYKTSQRQAQEFARVQEQIKEGLETYPDYNEKTAPVFEALIADLDSPVSRAVGESPVFQHLMYTIGGDEGFLALAKSNPLLAVKKVGVMEALIMDQLASKGKETARDEKGQFQSAPEKKAKAVSDAPAPPAEVGGKGTPPADEVESAAKSDDVAGYMAAANRRDLASRKR